MTIIKTPSKRPQNALKTLLHVGPSVYRIENTTAGFNNGQWKELRYDIDESVEPDITGSMTDMSNVATGSVNAVYSAHNLEHLYPHEVPVALAEFHRVLANDGFVVLTCPDLKSVAALIVEDKLEDPAYIVPGGPVSPIDILYGWRGPMQRGNLYMAHKTGFTGKTLMQHFLNAGFNRVIVTARPNPAFDLWIVASKNMCTEDELNELAAAHFPQ